MGRNQIEKVIGFFDAVINLLLVVHPQGNIVNVKPNGIPQLRQTFAELLGKLLTVGTTIGNKRILEGVHGNSCTQSLIASIQPINCRKSNRSKSFYVR